MIIDYKYKWTYNIKSTRLQNYDYGENWGYFITICTEDRRKYFWEIVDWEMILNEFGKIVYEEVKNIWIFRENVILDEFIIMPNHIHMIIIIENNKCRDVSLKRLWEDIENSTNAPNWDVLDWDVSAKRLYESDKFNNNHFSNISPKKGTIGNVIKLFKWYTKKKINQLWDQTHIYFSWQWNYYERIIRNEIELQKTRKYILDNPLQWEFDKDNTENLFM